MSGILTSGICTSIVLIITFCTHTNEYYGNIFNTYTLLLLLNVQYKLNFQNSKTDVVSLGGRAVVLYKYKHLNVTLCIANKSYNTNGKYPYNITHVGDFLLTRP